MSPFSAEQIFYLDAHFLCMIWHDIIPETLPYPRTYNRVKPSRKEVSYIKLVSLLETKVSKLLMVDYIILKGSKTFNTKHLLLFRSLKIKFLYLISIFRIESIYCEKKTTLFRNVLPIHTIALRLQAKWKTFFWAIRFDQFPSFIF